MTCKREQGKPFRTPPVAALPDFRVREAMPFSKVSVDFAGPLLAKLQTGEMTIDDLVGHDVLSVNASRMR